MSLVYCKPRGGEGRGGGRKNKMEQQTYPHPPKKKDEAARTPRRTIFQSFDLRGMGESHFSVYFLQDCQYLFSG